MKHKKLLCAGVASMALLMTGCNTYVDSLTPIKPLDNTCSYQFTSLSGLGKSNYKRVDSSKMRTSLRDVFLSGQYLINCPTTGNVNVLVLPIDFSMGGSNNQFYSGASTKYYDDYTSTSTYVGGDTANQKLENIKKAFAGSKEDGDSELYFYSLSEFYKKSSQGKLNLDAWVAPWYKYDMTPVDFNQDDSLLYSLEEDGEVVTVQSSKQWGVLDAAVEAAKKAYNEQRKKGDPTFAQKFDSDHDGYIDACYMVPSAPIDQDEFWAFTFWKYCDGNYIGNANGNKKDPKPHVYVWASYDFMLDYGESHELDTHTYIHEFGHMLGLEDYYSYDSGKSGTLGFCDMMDNNIGDHNPYSKTVMGWTKPYVVTGDCTIKLKPYQTSNECIILPRSGSWNGTAFDEYIMLQYYTPTGLYKIDAENSLFSEMNSTNSSLTMPSQSGVWAYHVDSRLIKESWLEETQEWSIRGYSDYCYADKSGQVSFSLGNSNTYSRGVVQGNYLISSIASDKKDKNASINFFQRNGTFTGDSLFSLNGGKSSATFGFNNYKQFDLNERYTLDYAFEITEMDENGVTIVFDKGVQVGK
ncbi:MAG: hypothetical protein HUJ61_00875 [Bacilli bacterium]|nr:hypothetical protein [Bacilli bacterium]